ncbi:hypothetical protein WL30_00030 [Burkholderia ubonensis]|uniref:hypothetical protein n=1 Tax=Burkholderia ubonensis TaxID=101571 RepID=UPI000759B51B|nr:hypothetical protein [Burkholderia ubonensis]KWA77749.1 hypothetical protein WL30_00030 [Burkholderia ubonensis]KWB32213.1 hypothetical protein WL31_25405 [Burkholderia ubonensis]
MHHQTTTPKARAQEAISIGLKMTAEWEGPDDTLRTIMALLSDVPVEPLLEADPERKGSVLGLLTLGYVLRVPAQEAKLRRMLASGEGVVIVRVTGGYNDPRASVELFDDWESYQDFLKPKIEAGQLQKTRGSTLL